MKEKKYAVSMYQQDYEHWKGRYHRYIESQDELDKVEKNEPYLYPDELCEQEQQTYSLYLGHLTWVLDPYQLTRKGTDEDGEPKLPHENADGLWKYRWATEEEAEKYMIERITYVGA